MLEVGLDWFSVDETIKANVFNEPGSKSTEKEFCLQLLGFYHQVFQSISKGNYKSVCVCVGCVYWMSHDATTEAGVNVQHSEVCALKSFAQQHPSSWVNAVDFKAEISLRSHQH